MGYSTYFDGSFELDRPLTPQLYQEMLKFSKDRHGSDTLKYSGMPGFWCDWEPTGDMQHIRHNGNEKFYSYVDWLQFIINRFLKPNKYVSNGEVRWQGENVHDSGWLVVKDNVVGTRQLK